MQVVASDGVLDNLFDSELITLIQRARASANTYDDTTTDADIEYLARLCANEIAAAARYNASCKDREGPFAVEAKKHGYHFPGECDILDSLYTILVISS